MKQRLLALFLFPAHNLPKLKETTMRNLPIPAGQPAPRFVEVQQHLFDIHLSFGKWSAHIATKSGIGRFFGPLRNEGRFYLTGKCVTMADCYLPHQVKHALMDAGFDCAAIKIV